MSASDHRSGSEDRRIARYFREMLDDGPDYDRNANADPALAPVVLIDDYAIEGAAQLAVHLHGETLEALGREGYADELDDAGERSDERARILRGGWDKP